ncbi:hypothetical protein B6S59_22840, partial [Pseudomonas sp. A46]
MKCFSQLVVTGRPDRPETQRGDNNNEQDLARPSRGPRHAWRQYHPAGRGPGRVHQGQQSQPGTAQLLLQPRLP